jgi:hypothetical protein
MKAERPTPKVFASRRPTLNEFAGRLCQTPFPLFVIPSAAEGPLTICERSARESLLWGAQAASLSISAASRNECGQYARPLHASISLISK